MDHAWDTLDETGKREKHISSSESPSQLTLFWRDAGECWLWAVERALRSPRIYAKYNKHRRSLVNLSDGMWDSSAPKTILAIESSRRGSRHKNICRPYRAKCFHDDSGAGAQCTYLLFFSAQRSFLQLVSNALEMYDVPRSADNMWEYRVEEC